MTTSSALLSLDDERFVSLTTFRKSGERVSTPVWIARDGDSLIVTTPTDTGKVKRLRNDPRVELTPCSRMGTTADDAVPVPGVAAIVGDTASVERLSTIFARKYRLEYHLFMVIEAIVAKKRKPRVILRISPTE